MIIYDIYIYIYIREATKTAVKCEIFAKKCVILN